MKKSEPKIKAFVLRAPESLLAKLTEIATINDHSLNSYLNSELKKIVAKSKQLN
ncbi:MAG: Arc family DNA-binding protein [Bacteroidales bacterium]|nr:Arc family DNA-binding protein [Bacteroidales bacterium]